MQAVVLVLPIDTEDSIELWSAIPSRACFVKYPTSTSSPASLKQYRQLAPWQTVEQPLRVMARHFHRDAETDTLRRPSGQERNLPAIFCSFMRGTTVSCHPTNVRIAFPRCERVSCGLWPSSAQQKVPEWLLMPGACTSIQNRLQAWLCLAVALL